MKPTVVNTCDGWQSYSSFRLVGVFTNMGKLYASLDQLLKDESIEWSDSEEVSTTTKGLTIAELQDDLHYINFNSITLNEKQ